MERLRHLEAEIAEQLALRPMPATITHLWQELFGKKGTFATMLRELKGLSAAARKEQGALIHAAKARLEAQLKPLLPADALLPIAAARVGKKQPTTDVTLPGRALLPGMPHPLREIEATIIRVLLPLGFNVVHGPWIEHEWYNFTALNIQADHPARDMQDTFFVGSEHVLRTHTSSVQVRAMQHQALPLRILAPGMVFRRDAFDATHAPAFHQMEGLWLDDRATFADLKGVLIYLLQSLFGEEALVRFRPSFFPFTEPSCEVDVACQACQTATFATTDKSHQTCRICQGQGWLEVLGAGMVDPFVLKAAGYSADKVQGFAFGMGLERLAMLAYGIDDIRLFYDNDLRFLAQLSGQAIF